MEQHEQERFDLLYAQHMQALKLQGKRGVSRHRKLDQRRHQK